MGGGEGGEEWAEAEVRRNREAGGGEGRSEGRKEVGRDSGRGKR